jgi:hypothetical protein
MSDRTEGQRVLADMLPTSLDSLRDDWRRQWPHALAAWSRFVRLSEPRWCLTTADEKREQLSSSFAMIRLADHAVVISLRQVQERKLEQFAVEIMAHEIGHHVYTPADLTDNARVQTRIRAGLPTRERLAPMVANLYEDLLINDRLQRSAGLNLAGVYQQLGSQPSDGQPPDRFWTLYMRIYEVLWKLDRGTLASGSVDERLAADAQLGARLIRSYTKNWVDGAGRFAVLCLPYLLDDDKAPQAQLGAWADTLSAGAGGLPEGLTQVEEGEQEGAIHPAEDPELSGIETTADEKTNTAASGNAAVTQGESGQKSNKSHREPFEYAEVLKAAGVNLPEELITAQYYRERAQPYLISFPIRQIPQAIDPLPEGLDVWDISASLEEIDWTGTLLTSPIVIPGETTRRRIYGESPGTSPDRVPLDLYLGVDCSGSMYNPAHALSYPVLAGAIIALSALRAGSRVMAVLSGEPGRTIATDGFVRDEAAVLKLLTGYLGTGTTFGIHRLADTFGDNRPGGRAVHILIITDNDIFSMLNNKNHGETGWDVARQSLANARGGGTFVLHLPGWSSQYGKGYSGYDRMEEEGWIVSPVSTLEELIAFARRFSQTKYGT